MSQRWWRGTAFAIGYALALGAALALAACTGGKATPTPTATATATLTPSPSPSASPLATATALLTSLHDVNFEAPAIAGPLIDRAGGGEVHQNRVLFADLIGHDGVDEAVAIVDSGGTAGEIGAGVFRLEEGRPVLVQFLRYNGHLEIRQGLIVTLEGVYAPGDPQSSPSKLREIAYRWDGTAFTVFTDQVIANPSR